MLDEPCIVERPLGHGSIRCVLGLVHLCSELLMQVGVLHHQRRLLLVRQDGVTLAIGPEDLRPSRPARGWGHATGHPRLRLWVRRLLWRLRLRLLRTAAGHLARTSRSAAIGLAGA